MMSQQEWELVDQERSPRHDVENGVDYGSPGRILVRKGHLSLVWQPGGSYWSGMYGTLYSPATLEVRGLSRTGQDLHEGGRLSKAVIQTRAERIDSFFGEGVAARIHTRKTLIIPAEPVTHGVAP